MFPHLTSNEIDLAKSIISLLTVLAPMLLKKVGDGPFGLLKK
jgi:hypothetical protein